LEASSDEDEESDNDEAEMTGKQQRELMRNIINRDNRQERRRPDFMKKYLVII
jgi:hypothetical protein